MTLSNSRIYIFNISYKGSSWISVLEANELSGIIANLIKTNVPNLNFKNFQFINIYINKRYSCEIHINKLKYRERRILTKEDIKELRNILQQQFKSIQLFKYEQLHVVNDEFSKIPSTGFLIEDNLYV